MICDHHQLPTCRHLSRLRAAALSGAERAESLWHIQSLGQPQKLEKYKVCIKCVEMDLIPRLDRASVHS